MAVKKKLLAKESLVVRPPALGFATKAC